MMTALLVNTMRRFRRPICRQKAWLEQFLPEVVSCQREASLSVMAMGHGLGQIDVPHKLQRMMTALLVNTMRRFRRIKANVDARHAMII
jgi:hypothetical protein